MNKRMGALVRMLSSTNEGEMLNAVRGIGSMLTSNGKTWHDLADHIERWGGSAPAASTTPQKNYNVYPGAAPPRTYRQNAEQEVDLLKAKEMIDELLNGDGFRRMPRKDQNFVEGMGESFDLYQDRTRVSSGQYAWMERLHSEYVTGKGRRR